MKRSSWTVSLILFSLILISSCSSNEDSISGNWRVYLESSGGELPFFIKIEDRSDSGLKAWVINGDESLPFSDVERSGNNIKFTFDHYDSYLEGVIDPSGKNISGTWSRRAMRDSRTEMNFYATLGEENRFKPVDPDEGGSPTISDISGEWKVQFGDESEESKSIGIFEQNGKNVAGTFLTVTGDYRFLDGTYENGILRLSCFDGAHAFLFKAELDENGIMKGDFWSRNSHVSEWTAVKGESQMPDAYQLTKLTNDENSFSFNFPDIDGNMVSDKDPRFNNKPMIVYIFGSWCPNCNDEAEFLVELYRRYHDKGLEIIGLANEFSGEFDKDAEIVRTFSNKYGIEWPMLIVGIADKRKTQEALKDLDRVLAYPTTIFINKNGKVEKIHTAFEGPGTGKYHEKLKSEFIEIIEDMLSN
ncbi:TlpA disulfide reductase family protein [candidate division KSB1 bacterium]